MDVIVYKLEDRWYEKGFYWVARDVDEYGNEYGDITEGTGDSPEEAVKDLTEKYGYNAIPEYRFENPYI